MNLSKLFAELERRNIDKVAIPVVALVTPALLRVDPTWDPLRADPDFKSSARKRSRDHSNQSLPKVRCQNLF
jgi:hypothetical protein